MKFATQKITPIIRNCAPQQWRRIPNGIRRYCSPIEWSLAELQAAANNIRLAVFLWRTVFFGLSFGLGLRFVFLWGWRCLLCRLLVLLFLFLLQLLLFLLMFLLQLLKLLLVLLLELLLFRFVGLLLRLLGLFLLLLLFHFLPFLILLFAQVGILLLVLLFELRVGGMRGRRRHICRWLRGRTVAVILRRIVHRLIRAVGVHRWLLSGLLNGGWPIGVRWRLLRRLLHVRRPVVVRRRRLHRLLHICRPGGIVLHVGRMVDIIFHWHARGAVGWSVARHGGLGHRRDLHLRRGSRGSAAYRRNLARGSDRNGMAAVGLDGLLALCE